MKREHALDAQKHSRSIDSGLPDSAPVYVLGIIEAANAPVYNLSVDGEGEYFANGILVHNCDTDLYTNTFLTGDRKPDDVARAEKLKELEKKGVDQRSLAVIKWKLERKDQQKAAALMFGRPSLSRTHIRR